MGAAMLAGLAVGTWSGTDELTSLIRRGECYEPRMGAHEVERLRSEWHVAVRRALL